MKIAELLAQNNALLAPMAGVTDMPFRAICKEFGCGLTCTEMISAKGLHYGGAYGRTKSLCAIADIEKPCAVQLFGNDPGIMAEQAAALSEELGSSLAAIDINMGCPAPKITSNGEGGALMRDLPLASRVIRAVSDASQCEVTVKFRKGWDDKSVNAVEFAIMAEQCGAAAITLHGRTRIQYYAGKADWDIIRSVVDAVSIPVVGNGDIFCADDARAMLDVTGCSAVMVARGAQGNPWIFREIRALLDMGQLISPPSPSERIRMALRHAKSLVEFRGERAAVEMRKHVPWYIKGMEGAAAVRDRVNRCTSYSELEDVLLELLKSLE